MCNTVKDCRDYELFVVLFKEFLQEHGERYRAADPDKGRSNRRMVRKFNSEAPFTTTATAAARGYVIALW
jgi:hypothetical protein